MLSKSLSVSVRKLS